MLRDAGDWAKAVCPELQNIAAASVKKLVTSNTVAVIAADWSGTRHDARGVRAACDARNLLYIEDTSFLPPSDGNPAICSLADLTNALSQCWIDAKVRPQPGYCDRTYGWTTYYKGCIEPLHGEYFYLVSPVFH